MNTEDKTWLNRTKLLLKETGLNKLVNSNILIVGLGGVGAYAAENICRAGVGKMTIIDGDTINETNINRQLPALNSNIGEYKADILEKRFLDINPELKLKCINQFITADNIQEILDSEKYTYIIDAIDSLSPKVTLCLEARKRNIPIICSMGAGGRIDPSKIEITDISKTYNDGLAAAFRQKLRKEGVKSGVKVVFSSETAKKDAISTTETDQHAIRSVRGTISYLPAIFGCMLAGYVIQQIVVNNS
ncbi:MAG: tRNA threonylcarbamoyladenosine dehydratase [Bacteroidales bacterium]|jgi:tRNA A37 threonylcarbamoyladenosine dehydratase|nr:tRNA threonylcarbamoyladenosine dehydratase [Bacteroidales bacterium]